MLRVLKYCKDSKIVVFIDLNSGMVYERHKDELRGIKLENAVLDKNGILKHKPGTENFTIVVGESFDLELYKNRKKYDGNTRKFGITFHGIDYIVKYPKRKGDISTITEYVASAFIKNIGCAVHDVSLTRDGDVIVAVIRDFTSDGILLHSYKDTKQSSENTDLSSKEYSYSDVIHMIKQHNKIPESMKQDVIRFFWRMFLFDAVLANRDRHWGNWGYIVKDGVYSNAPIYDNGGCLFPDMDRTVKNYSKDRKKFLMERSDYFPASLLRLNSKRSNYYEAIQYLYESDSLFKEEYSRFYVTDFSYVVSCAKKSVTHSLIGKTYQEILLGIILMRWLHMINRVDLETCYLEVEKCLK